MIECHRRAATRRSAFSMSASSVVRSHCQKLVCHDATEKGRPSRESDHDSRRNVKTPSILDRSRAIARALIDCYSARRTRAPHTGRREKPKFGNHGNRRKSDKTARDTQEITQSTWPACTAPDPSDEAGRAFVPHAIIANPVTYGHFHCAAYPGASTPPPPSPHGPAPHPEFPGAQATSPTR